MTDSTVSADLPQREPGEALKAAIKQVRVSELMRGDWVSAGFMHDRNAVEVLTVEAYNDDHDGVFCKVLGRFHAEGEPSMFTRYAADTVLLADDEEIEAQQAHWRRSRVVAHLNRVARLIQDDELPVGGPSDPVRISLRLNDVDELHRLAAILGAQVKTDGVEFTVMWPATEREAASAPVEVVWRAYRSDIAADPLGMASSRNDDGAGAFVPGDVAAYIRGVTSETRGAEIQVVHEAEQDRAIGTATVPVAETVTEHYETTGWVGGNAGCGTSCACGVTFDGFVALAEARAQLKQHIADEAGQ